MTQLDSINGFRRQLKASGKSQSTIESYCRDARDFLAYVESIGMHIEEIEPETLVNFARDLEEKERENSIRRKIIGIRQFYRHYAETTKTFDSPLDHVPIPARNEELPNGLEDDDMDEILATLHAKTAGIKKSRDIAILYLLALEGLKANELIQLKWSNYLNSKTTSTLHILGSRERTICLSTESRDALTQYHDDYSSKLREFRLEKDSMFISFKGREFATVLPKMSRHGLKFLLYEMGELAGIKHLNTEILRHYAIQYQLSQGKSSGEVMAHFGLRRPGNIARYVQKFSP